MPIDPPDPPLPSSNLPEPVARKANDRKGWLSTITPENVRRIAKGIGHIAGVASRLSDAASQTMRDNKSRDTIAAAVADRVAAGIRSADPQFERAFDREKVRLLREQQTLDDVADIASEALSKKVEADFAKGDLDDDWLYQFEAAAKGFTSERMKHTFGRILSGEILRPGTFSPATLRALTTLSAFDASLISVFVSMTYQSTIEGMAPQLYTAARSAGGNGLKEFGLNYSNLATLQQCGFLQHDLTTHSTVAEALLTGVPGFLGNRFGGFRPVGEPDHQRKIRVAGLMPTTVGVEICRVVDRNAPPEAYVVALKQHFESVHKLTLLLA